MWGLESRSRPRTSRSRLLWQSLGLISKFEPGLGLGVGLGGYGLDYITGILYQRLWYLILIPYLSKLRATFFGIWRICTKCKACLSSTDNLWGRQISANNRTLIFNFSNFPHNPQTNILYHRLWYFIQIPHLSKFLNFKDCDLKYIFVRVPGSIFTKCNIICLLRGFQPITARNDVPGHWWSQSSHAYLATSNLYETTAAIWGLLLCLLLVWSWIGACPVFPNFIHGAAQTFCTSELFKISSSTWKPLYVR